MKLEAMALASVAFLYALMSFVLWNADASMWTFGERYFMAFCVIGISMFYAIGKGAAP